MGITDATTEKSPMLAMIQAKLPIRSRSFDRDLVQASWTRKKYHLSYRRFPK